MLATAGNDSRYGVYDDIPNHLYHLDKETFSSSIIKLMEAPADAKHAIDGEPEYKDEYRIGTALHTLVLEPEKFDSECLTGITAGRSSNNDKQEWCDFYASRGWISSRDWIIEDKKSAKTWAAGFHFATGKIMVTPDEIEALKRMRDSVKALPEYSDLLEGGAAEQSIYWQDKETGLNLRCRPDYLNSFCTDLKSCQTTEPSAVSRSIQSLGYYISAAMYEDGIQAVTGEYRPFIFVFVEKKAPFKAVVHGLDDTSKEFARSKYREYLGALANCCKTGRWPGYKNNFNLSLPAWALK